MYMNFIGYEYIITTINLTHKYGRLEALLILIVMFSNSYKYIITYDLN